LVMISKALPQIQEALQKAIAEMWKPMRDANDVKA
jgi:hypothetical protein